MGHVKIRPVLQEKELELAPKLCPCLVRKCRSLRAQQAMLYNIPTRATRQNMHQHRTSYSREGAGAAVIIKCLPEA